MPSFTLTDAANDTWIETFHLASDDDGGPPWSISKTRLRGGRREGVDLIRVDNGALSFSVIPSRGMNLWKGQAGKIALGWNSPVNDGPVNPAFVDANAWGNLGWLDGFDELLARCGLDSFGPPYEEAGRTYPLHGRISNLPAHVVKVHIDDAFPHAITIEGHVNETRMFLTSLRMVSKITTVPGSNTITVRDEFTNLRDVPSELQVLYHWNFGPPLMEVGGGFCAPFKTLVPRDRAATEGLASYDVYGPPVPGSAEQAFYFELLGDGPKGNTVALLHNRNKNAGIALRFSTQQLPAFILWKAQGGMNDGYVTGLEPSTGYPNPKPFERSRKRVMSLAPGQSYVTETTLEVLQSAKAVSDVIAEIQSLQTQAVPVIYPKPVEPFTSEG